MGRAPMAYLTWWRLTLAATRLRDTDASLATVPREADMGARTPCRTRSAGSSG
ncbi:hypothetical protein ACRAWF_01295 [Streptomyces sp. L7]